MPPKKMAGDSKEGPKPTKSDVQSQKKKDTKGDAGAEAGATAARKLPAHPSTAVMVKEAIKALDSRKGVSSQAIMSYIKQTYPSVDPVRLKHLVRNGLKKGLENGTLVRPANSTVPPSATGKFRLGPEVKKPKTENTDPNEQKAPKAAKGEAKAKKEGTTRKKKTADEPTTSSKDLKPPKSEDESVSVSKVPPAKKPKSSVDKAGASKSSAATKKKASQKKAAEGGSDAPAVKAPGRQGKKTAE